MTAAQLRLDSLDYTTPAINTSNVGIFFIRPTPHTLLDPTNPTDAGLLELYNYIMNDGLLVINKMPLVITPRDTTLTYGQKVGNFTFNYSYADSNIAPSDKMNFLSEIDSIHHSNYIDTAFALVNTKTVLRGETLTDDDLNLLSMMASTKTVLRTTQIINTKTVLRGATVYDTTRVVDVPVETIFNYKVDSTNATIVNGRAILSGLSILDGTATLSTKTVLRTKRFFAVSRYSMPTAQRTRVTEIWQ